MKIIDAANLDYRAVMKHYVGQTATVRLKAVAVRDSLLPVCLIGILQSMEFREMHWAHI